MENPINEEMIVSNLVGSVFDCYKNRVKAKVREWFISYDPRKSISKDYIVHLFEVVYECLSDICEEIEV